MALSKVAPASARRVAVRIAAALAVALFLVAVYRAATQAITVDEAATYVDFASLPYGMMWKVYNPNHHVLHTILCYFSTRILPLSEFSLRLPALLGAALYLAAAFRICRLLFARASVFLAAFALLTLNPFVLDQLSVARGYGLAAGLWLWSLYWALSIVGRDDPRASRFELSRIGLALGLAIAAHLSFAFVSVAEAVLLLPCLFGARIRRLCSGALWLLGPAAAVVAALVLPVVFQNREGYVLGAATPTDAFLSLSAFSLLYKSASFDVFGIPRALGLGALPWIGLSAVAGVLTASSAAVSMARSLYFWRRTGRFAALSGEARSVFLIGGQLVLALCAAGACHFLFRIPYPAGRTGLYVLIGFTLLLPFTASAWNRAGAAPLEAVNESVGRRKRLPHKDGGLSSGRLVSMYGLFIAIACLCAGRFIQEFNVRSFVEWKFDATSKALFLRLREMHSRSGLNRPARVAATVRLAAPFEFYRRATRAAWIETTPAYPESVLVDLIQYGAFDYAVLLPEDEFTRTRVATARLWKDPVTGAEITVPEHVRPTAPGLVLGGDRKPPRADPVACTDDSDPRIAFSGVWTRDTAFEQPLNGTITYSDRPGAAFDFPFTGRAVAYYYTGALNRGMAEIRMDGSPLLTLDEYSPRTVWRSRARIEAGPGAHVLTVRVLGRRNPRSRDSFVDVDCLAVER